MNLLVFQHQNPPIEAQYQLMFQDLMDLPSNEIMELAINGAQVKSDCEAMCVNEGNAKPSPLLASHCCAICL